MRGKRRNCNMVQRAGRSSILLRPKRCLGWLNHEGVRIAQ
jgi:hypothetical protein